jgi:hypothetical protein
VEDTFREPLRKNELLRKAFLRLWLVLDQVSLCHGSVPTGLVFDFVSEMCSSDCSDTLKQALLQRVESFSLANQIKYSEDTIRLIKREISSFASVYALNVMHSEADFRTQKVPPRLYQPRSRTPKRQSPSRKESWTRLSRPKSPLL